MKEASLREMTPAPAAPASGPSALAAQGTLAMSAPQDPSPAWHAEVSARLFAPLQDPYGQPTKGNHSILLGPQEPQTGARSQESQAGSVPLPTEAGHFQAGVQPLPLPDLAALIQEAVQRGIASEMQHRTSSWVSDLSRSQEAHQQSQISEDLEQAQVQDYTRASPSQGSVAGEEVGEQGLSDDEDLSPDQPLGLFKSQVFRSLLHKAKITTGLGLPQPKSDTAGERARTSVPLFEESNFEVRRSPVQSCSRTLS